jgi:hypothetical protein
MRKYFSMMSLPIQNGAAKAPATRREMDSWPANVLTLQHETQVAARKALLHWQSAR